MQPPIPRCSLERNVPGDVRFVALPISHICSGSGPYHGALLFEQRYNFFQNTLQPLKRRRCRCWRQQRRDLFHESLIVLAQQVHTEFALVGVPAIECPLPDSGGHSNLMHADSVDAMLGKEVSRNLQNALAMLRCIAPFVPPVPLEQLRYARRPWTIVGFFSHYSHPLTSGQLSATMLYVDICPHIVYHIVPVRSILRTSSQTFGDHACHPERSEGEGSGSTDGEILRFAQNDSQDISQVRSREVFSPNV